MNVSLTPELERFVQEKVHSGRYTSASRNEIGGVMVRRTLARGLDGMSAKPGGLRSWQKRTFCMVE